MKVYLTFDIEVWCNSWEQLDERFPASFERYVYGRSAAGDYALPKTLEILGRHGLRGVFFVEPLFSARFGVQHLRTIVELIRAGGHDIQLHLHPEWTDEISPLVFPGADRKRQHLSFYSLEEQSALIALGARLLAEAGGGPVGAFRAGSFAANADTYRALRLAGIGLDSSLNVVHPDSGLDLRDRLDFCKPGRFEGVDIFPMSVFRDGTGRLRPAQVGACSFAEMSAALESAWRSQCQHFVVLSHNFEMLKQGQSVPDAIVARRFEQLCRYLAAHPDKYEVTAFAPLAPEDEAQSQAGELPSAPWLATLRRHVEQGVRRIVG